MDLHPNQQAAIDKACTSKVSIVTGGAGTGKTTIIKAIAEKLGRASLCAFAGKAAARLKEATGREASTIHRLLGSDGTRFRRESLEGVNVIVDEASMVSSAILAEIVRRTPERLILVGDESQLAPVDGGQPFHDMIRLRPDLVANLTHCYRNSEAVFEAATAIRNGEHPALKIHSKSETWEVRKTGDMDDTHRAILAAVFEGQTFDFEQDLILCPRNGKTVEERCTCASLNRDIVDIVNPRTNGEDWLPRDRVINTKNFADKDVWNGTTGTIHDVCEDGQIWVRLDFPVVDWDNDPSGKTTKDLVLFTKKMVRSLKLAYVLTVHKSQGSQYRRVWLIALKRDAYSLLNNKMIYTGVTRAREECVVVGQPKALWDGIRNNSYRRTVIQELAR